jgi:hypothetical protein
VLYHRIYDLEKRKDEIDENFVVEFIHRRSSATHFYVSIPVT